MGKNLNRFVIVLFLALAPAGARAEVFQGRVVGIQDGDTINVLHDKAPRKVRLLGVDCPEKKQAFGERAKLFVSSLAFGKGATVKASKIDRYGRTLGEVWVGEKNLSQELLRAGLAWHYRQFSKDAELQRLEDVARVKGLGLWVDPDPVAPWDFRKSRKRR